MREGSGEAGEGGENDDEAQRRRERGRRALAERIARKAGEKGEKEADAPAPAVRSLSPPPRLSEATPPEPAEKELHEGEAEA